MRYESALVFLKLIADAFLIELWINQGNHYLECGGRRASPLTFQVNSLL